MTNFGTMGYKHIISVVLCMFSGGVRSHRKGSAGGKLMAEKRDGQCYRRDAGNQKSRRTNLTNATMRSTFYYCRSHAPETAVECETDTLCGHQMDFSESEILCMPNRRCTARRTWTGRLYRMKDAMQSFSESLFPAGSLD